MSETEDENNRFRLRFLIRECGRCIFRYRVEQKVTPLTLENFLQDSENKQKLDSLRGKRVITEEQYALLYPDSESPSIEYLDITLLLVILRTLCCSKHCDDPIWYKGSKPMANDDSLEADLVRIRDHKNELEEATGPEITTEFFEGKWVDLCLVFLRLGNEQKELKDLLERARTTTHDAEKEKEFLADFLTWKKMEQQFEAGLDLTITEFKSLRFKLYSLVVDGGTRVLRHYLDDRIPPEDLQTTIDKYNGTLTWLRSKGIIKAFQYELLFPNSEEPSSETFDITLLAVCLRNICGLNKKDPVWNSNNPPLPANTTPEADIVRLRDIRNKLSHLSKTGDLTTNTFEKFWRDITQVLSRLNGACSEPLSNLQEEMNILKRKTVDPQLEKKYQDVIGEWMKMDEKYESKIIQAVSRYSAFGIAMERRKITVKDVLDDKYFVKTSQFENARQKLEENNIIVLNGAPGEGKTTVAKKLLAEVSQNERYIQLHTYTDWDKVKLDSVDVVLIDDMFGSRVFNKEEYRKWQKHIPSIAAAIEKTHMKVVITSRSYILNEALDQMHVKSVFDDKYIVSLSSKDLSKAEKEEILKNHFKKAGNKNTNICQRLSQNEHLNLVKEITELKLEEPVCLMIGYPECARLFANTISLYDKGVSFFKNPMACVQSYMTKLLKEEDDTFIAFFVLWAQQSKTLTSIELERPVDETSKSITGPLCKLQFSAEDRIRSIRHALRKHRGGFIHFDNKNEIFSFSHRVIQDAVGLVSYEINTTATIAFSDSAFIENFMRVDVNVRDEAIDVHPLTNYYENTMREDTQNVSKQEIRDQSGSEDSGTEVEQVIHLSRTRYSQVSLRLGHLLFPDGSQENNISVSQRYLDPTVFKTALFDNKEFCEMYIKVMKEQQLLPKVFTTPIRSVDSEFVGFRFLKHVKTEIRLPAFLIWIQGEICLMTNIGLDIMRQGFDAVLQDELHIALLISVKLGSETLVKYLLEKSTKIDITHVLLAIATKNKDLARLLLKESNLFSENETSCIALNVDVFSQLLPDETQVIKNDYLSLIKRAVTGGHVEAFKILLQYCMSQRDMDFKTEGNQFSLFHFVVFQKNVDLINVLLESGIWPTDVDNKGRTPFLHAIVSNEVRIAERLLEISIRNGLQCIPDKKGNTPLMVSLMNVMKVEGRDQQVLLDIALKLCQFEENVHLVNSKDDTAMRLACRNGLIEIVNELLMHEDPMKKKGTTFFHHFVTASDLESIRTLLKSGIDPNIHDEYHRTPFMLANVLGKTSVIRLLQNDPRIERYNKQMGIVTANAEAGQKDNSPNELTENIPGNPKV